MPIIDNFELPKNLVLAMEGNVRELPDEIILALVKSCPERFGGFRAIKKNIEKFRQLIIGSMLSKGQEVPAELSQILSLNILSQRLISELPIESLHLFHDDFLDFWDQEQYLISLLTDDREEVREIAIEWIKESELDTELGSDPDDLQEQKEEKPETKQKLRELKTSLVEARRETVSERKRNKGLERKIAKLKSELGAHKTRYDREKEKANAEHECSVQKQQELDRLQSDMQDKIQKGINIGLQEAMRTWLARPTAIESLVEDDVPSLFDRVNRALERQDCVDKHSGNMRVLKERLLALEQAKQKVDQAREEALQPVQELSPLSCELADEIEKIRSEINVKYEQSGPLLGWQAKINETTSHDELGEISRLLQGLHDLNLLPSQDFQVLRNQIRQVRDRLVSGKNFLEEEIAVTALTGKVQQVKSSHDLNLIVDGHNVIFGPDSYYLFNEYSKEAPEFEKRSLLTSMNKQAFENNTDITVTVFFDSPVYSENVVASNIQEIYSGGGQEDQRADNAIINYLQDARTKSQDRQYVLVTNDRDLAFRACKSGAETISVFDYGVMLRRWQMSAYD